MTDHFGEATQKVIDLDALEKLADEATPGPWERSDWTHDGYVISANAGWLGEIENKSDAAFIAAANPATIKALIAELKAGREAVEELLYAHTDKSIAMGKAFLARNGGSQ